MGIGGPTSKHNGTTYARLKNVKVLKEKTL